MPAFRPASRTIERVTYDEATQTLGVRFAGFRGRFACTRERRSHPFAE